MGIFLNQSLKSSEGSKEWLEFFSITSSAFAYLEKTPLVPGYENLTKEKTFKQVKDKAIELKIIEKLQGYNIATDVISSSKSAFHLIVLYPNEQRLTITPYGREEIEQANEAYTKIEKKMSKGQNLDAVLVSTGSIESLKKAYPNYFLDTTAFIKTLQKIIFAK